MSPRRARLAGVAASAGGSLLVLLAASRRWASVHPPTAVPGVPAAGAVHLAGSALAPGLVALGLVGLAGAAAVLALGSWWRVATGGLLVAVGACAVALAVHARAPAAVTAAVADAGTGLAHPAPAWTAWPYVAVAGGVVLVVGAMFVAVRGRRWPALGARYDAPAARPRPVDPVAAAWDALDRGHDPTA